MCILYRISDIMSTTYTLYKTIGYIHMCIHLRVCVRMYAHTVQRALWRFKSLIYNRNIPVAISII